MRVAMNMLVAPYYEPYLEYAITSVLWMDEFVIVNTGEDNVNLDTINRLAAKNGRDFKIVEYPSDVAFDFAHARRIATDNTESDFILKIDADEVYYNSFEATVRSLDFRFDVYEVEFYHFMLDMFHYEDVYPKDVLFRRGLEWTGAVHERLPTENVTRCRIGDRFCHFGYAQPQGSIFRKWKLYESLGGDAIDPDVDPEHILDDRIPMCKPFNCRYPETVEAIVKDAARAL